MLQGGSWAAEGADVCCLGLQGYQLQQGPSSQSEIVLFTGWFVAQTI